MTIDIIKIQKNKKLEQINKLAIEFYCQNLFNSEEGISYLKSRQIQLKTAGQFRVGYSNELKYKLDKYLTKNNILKKYITNLSRLHSNGKPLFSSKRIIFPVIKNEKPVSFTGRTVSDNGLAPKHLHSRGPLGGFYNHDRLNEVETLYVTEGPFDCLSLEQLGYPSIALLKCRYNPENNHYFSKIKKLIIVMDNDSNESGQLGSLRMGTHLLADKNLTLDVFIATLPKDTDCNQLCIEKKPYEIRSAIQHAIDLRYTEEYRRELEILNYRSQRKNYEEKLYSIALFDIVEYYLGPAKHDSNGKSHYICPFHEDKEPSLVIYHDTNTYYCFGCGKFGNQKTFIANVENISMKRADELLERICKNGTIHIPQNS